MKEKKLQKVIFVIGPTATGKSDLAVEIAKKVKGEIISADSRQIYKYLDIGSGKITKREMKGVTHYCLDIFEPGKTKPVTDYLKFANKAIKEIIKKGKTPIVCGGTGFYIDAILYGIPKNAKPNLKLRKELEKEEIKNLLIRIKKLNKEKYLELTENENSSERNNKRRLIRIIEILTSPQPLSKGEGQNFIRPLNKNPKYDAEFIITEKSKEEMRERINLRLKKRLEAKEKPLQSDYRQLPLQREAKYKNNLIDEIRFLRNELKIRDEWLISLGLEYKYVTLYLRGEINYEEMVENLQNKIWQFAKRQIVWNKRYKRQK